MFLSLDFGGKSKKPYNFTSQPTAKDPSGAGMRVKIAVVGLALSLLGTWVFAQSPEPQKPETSRKKRLKLNFGAVPTRSDDLRNLFDSKSEWAIRKGLDWLAKRQQRRGLWLSPKPGYQTGISSLAGLALLASGQTGRHSRHAEVVDKLVRHLVSNQRRERGIRGLFFDRSLELMGTRPMHGHGLALMFLCEVYGEIRSPDLQRKTSVAIQEGVELIVKNQNSAGGWYYFPGDGQDEGSVTVTQIQALRAARNAGFRVPTETIDQAVDYVKRSQDSNGGVHYKLNSGRTTPALTAAGLTVFHGAGQYHSEAIKKGFRYLDSGLKIKPGKGNHYFYYAHFYASQAYHQRGFKYFVSYYKELRQEILKLQRSDGRWTHDILGDSYSTAMALLILQLPKEYLPIYQR